MEQLHHAGKEPETSDNNHCRVGIHPGLDLRGHEGEILHSFDKEKVYNRGRADASEQADLPFKILAVIEREYHSRYELHHGAEEESYGHRKEYTYDYRKCFLGIQQIVESETEAARHFYQCHHERRPEKFEYHRDRCGRRHSERIENVQQNDVCHHHCHEDADEVVK